MEGREPAYAFRRQSLAYNAGAGAGAGTSAYALPADALPELTEVQSPPGRTLWPGDDYGVDGRAIRFRDPPAAAVVVLTRGAPARRSRDTQPCRSIFRLPPGRPRSPPRMQWPGRCWPPRWACLSGAT